jgi:hypothetical protein
MSRIADLFKGLMFLHGHFTRPEDLDPGFAPLGNRAASERWFARNPGDGAKAKPAELALAEADEPRRLDLLAHLQFLGGRPMHAGHNLDLEEPFEQLAPGA